MPAILHPRDDGPSPFMKAVTLSPDRWLYKIDGFTWHATKGIRAVQGFGISEDSDPPRKVIQRGAFFDAQRDNFILGRFTALEEAQRCAEADANGCNESDPQERGPRRSGEPWGPIGF